MPVALAPIVEEVIALLQASLPAGVEVSSKGTADAPCVLADPTQIHQVLLNLCTNAWQSLNNGAGHIEILLEEITLEAGAIHANSRAGRYAHMAVRDDGCGMEAAMIDRVFEPFFTTKGVGAGTGLGLSVVHGIVDAHHGGIRVESAPGRGTTVHLYFPAIREPAAQPDARSPASTAPRRGEGQQVLYLDDEEELVELVTALLGRNGYKVKGYTTSAQALAALCANPHDFDIVVTDYNMPDMSGLDVAHELARIRPDLPVVITSGYITDELQHAAEQAGVRQVIYKPNTVDELCNAVGRIVNAVRGSDKSS
jgi:CheY-like chemotaxis protein